MPGTVRPMRGGDLNEMNMELIEVRRLRREVETAAYIFERLAEGHCNGLCESPVAVLWSPCGMFHVNCCTLRNCAVRYKDLKAIEATLNERIMDMEGRHSPGSPEEEPEEISS